MCYIVYKCFKVKYTFPFLHTVAVYVLIFYRAIKENGDKLDTVTMLSLPA